MLGWSVQSNPSSRRVSGVRTDARRNAERIVRTAEQVFAGSGVDVHLEEIARRAGVSAATLYRHFASKDDLVRAVVEHAFANEVEPVLLRALHDEKDALTGLVTALEAAMAMIAQHRNALAAARQPGQFPVDVVAPFFERLAIILARAQRQGTVRADLHADDLPRLTLMVLNTMWLNDAPDNWRRYLVLLLDALQPSAARPLPSVTPVTAPLRLPDERPLRSPLDDPFGPASGQGGG
jgi:AcrR family transcriptional regulator